MWRENLQKYYPKAKPFRDSLDQINKQLGEHGFTPKNTLFANCTCRDEINCHDLALLSEYWGENFDLAGLGGIPSSGITGLSAYLHHVPDDGRMLIVGGPHIGINEQGVLGKVKREGMSQDSSACGALLACVEKLSTDENFRPEFDELDPEQYLLEKCLQPYFSEIIVAENKLQLATEKMLIASYDRLVKIVDTLKEDCPPVVLVFGVTINTPMGEDDYFDLRRFRNLAESQSFLA